MKQNTTSSLKKEFTKIKVEAKKNFKTYLKRNSLAYPKSEDEMYALIDKISARN